ncbi:MAG TPA: hypothetical protein VFO61_06110 [Alphaproteobacteria bacterium]|nr:hypothetical protein [Alphaproteobacteria bacterium]
MTEIRADEVDSLMRFAESAQRFRERAEAARAVADSTSDRGLRERVLGLAAWYETMAAQYEADAREVGERARVQAVKEDRTRAARKRVKEERAKSRPI